MLFITACSYVGTGNSGALSPIQAIERSAASAPKAVNNVFELQVKSSNSHQGLAFLNSEKDNLDQRNLVIALRPQAINQLKEKYGQSPQEYLLDKRIRVEGQARRIKTWVLFKNKNTRQYFYQTKIFVKSANQLTVL